MQTKTIQPKKYFCFVGQTTLNTISKEVGAEVDLLFEEAHKMKLEQNGPLEFVYFDSTEDKNKPFTLWIALPVKSEKPLTNSKYSFKEQGEFKCYTHIHKGDVSDLYEVYGNLYNDLFSKGMRPTNQIREVYEKFETLVSPENITEIQIGIQ